MIARRDSNQTQTQPENNSKTKNKQHTNIKHYLKPIYRGVYRAFARQTHTASLNNLIYSPSIMLF